MSVSALIRHKLLCGCALIACPHVRLAMLGGSFVVEPFRIHVTDEVLDDLRTRLRHARWPDQIPGIGWGQGAELDWLRRLVSYWANEFDWRAWERKLNALNQFKWDGALVGTSSPTVNRFSTRSWFSRVVTHCGLNTSHLFVARSCRYVDQSHSAVQLGKYALQIVCVSQPEQVHRGDRHPFSRTEKH
jgi:Epoxide hydrolase N terminus